MAASETRSSARVSPRSVTRVAAISRTTSSIVAAFDRTPPVQLMSPTVRNRTHSSNVASCGYRSTNSDAARHGQALFVRYGCSGCHVGNAAVRAPRLEGIFGKPVPVEGGKFLVADESYLRDSILLPTQHVAAGYAPLMPSYAGIVPEADLLDLIAYLQSLGTQTPPAAVGSSAAPL